MSMESPYGWSRGEFKDYSCPAARTPSGIFNEALVHGWLRSAISEGEQYLRSSRAYENIPKAIDLIMGKLVPTVNDAISNVFVNQIKRSTREAVAIQSNLRPFANYEANSTKEDTWLQQATILNNLFTDWYYGVDVPRALKGILQLAYTHGTGYLSPTWQYPSPRRGFRKVGDIGVSAYSWDSVLPVQMYRNDIQQAYAVLIKDEMPINLARRKWPHKAYQIKPDREQPSGWYRVISSVAGSIWDKWGRSDTANAGTSPTVDIFYCYVDDWTINETDHDIPMGDGYWQYTVPYLGKILDNGRVAVKEDCYLYPNRRLVTATRQGILDDDTSPYWHGMVPIIPFKVDEWIWDFLGNSVVAEVASIQASATSIRRYLQDAANMSLDPPLMGDEQMISESTMKKIKPKIPGMRIRLKMTLNERPLRPIFEAGQFKADQFYVEYVKYLDGLVDHIFGLPDLKALAKAKQIPAGDSIEKFFAQAGEITNDISKSMERSMTDLGYMQMGNFFEFYDAARRLKIMGKDGLTEQDTDFDPKSLIPDALPGEQPDSLGVIRSTRTRRAQYHMQNFGFHIPPNSIYQITHMAKKLLSLQAKKLDPLLIDRETLAKNLDIPNYGTFEGNTIKEKIKTQMKEDAVLQMEIQQAMQAASPEGQQQQAMQGLSSAIQSAVSGGGQPGRPPEFHGPPKLETKGPEGRPTVTGS